MSSEASRKSTRGVIPRVASSLRTHSRSPVKPRDRTSITTANCVMREPAASPSSTILAISSGGRLSATYQPMSSSTLAAVPRPAPDSPVTRTTSMPPAVSSATGSSTPSRNSSVIRDPPPASRCMSSPTPSSRCCAPIMVDDRFGRARFGWHTQRLQYCLRRGHADSRHRGDLLDAGLLQPGQRAEVGDQRLAAVLPETAYRVERRRRHPLRPLAAVVRDRESVRFVAYPLQQVKAFAVARQNYGIECFSFLRGYPHLLQPLGQPDHRDVGHAEFVEHRRRGVDL